MTAGNGPTRVPEPQLPRKRRSAASRVFLSLFLLVLIGCIAGGVAAFYGYQQYSLPGPLAANKVFEIDRGLGTPEIAAKLQEAGIISNARVFSAASLLSGSRGRLKAGEYEFQAGATMREVMDLLISGKAITYKLSVPEGWTSDMVVARLNENQVLTGDVAAAAPEGAIMPDTYVFRRGMTRQELLDQMQAAQVKLLEEIWTKRNPAIPLQTREEAVVLASIVEKETGLAEERPIIASVFMNRLKKGMRLQSDPTIIYGIAGGLGKLDRHLTKSDITTPTPYNTYTIDGLPPGPIANPGRAALEAVTNPPETAYLYFVADGTGGHAFASTLEEHNRNVAKWRDLAGNAATAEAAAETAAAQQPVVTAAEPPAVQTTKPPELPAVEDQPAQPAPGAEAEAAAADQAAATATTGEPAVTTLSPEIASPEASADGQPAVEAPAPDTTAGQLPAGEAATPEVPAKEVAKPAVPPPVAEAATAKVLKPGSVIRSGKRLIPVPKRKPKH